MVAPHDDNLVEGQKAAQGQRLSKPMGQLSTPHVDRVQAIIEEEKKAYLEQLGEAAPDMKSFAGSYVNPLFHSIADTVSRQSFDGVNSLKDSVRQAIVARGSEIYERVGKEVLGPLVVRFAECVLLHAPPGATVAFLARDAQPYFEAAQLLNQRDDLARKGLALRYVTLNRSHLGIVDENLEKGQQRPRSPEQRALTNEYLEQEGFANPKGVVIVDTGCWGSMIEKLLDKANTRGVDKLNIRYVFFMYSHNSDIFGFVNHVAKREGPRNLDKAGIFIGDTFECLPKGEQSSENFQRAINGKIQAVKRPIESEYLAPWGDAVLSGVKGAAALYLSSPERFPTASQALSILAEQKEEAKNRFTGVLPQATPEWSDGKDFLKRWKLSAIPPVGCLETI